jgi:hypothetical protein
MRKLTLLSTGTLGATVFAVVGYLLTGSAPAINSGPLGGGGVAGHECFVGKVVSISPMFNFTNRGTSAARITAVELDKASGLRQVASSVVPVVSGNTLGASAYPLPRGAVPPGVRWGDRTAAPAMVRPGESVTVAVEAVRTAGKGTAKGIDVYYRSGRVGYHIRTAISFTAQGSPCK